MNDTAEKLYNYLSNTSNNMGQAFHHGLKYNENISNVFKLSEEISDTLFALEIFTFYCFYIDLILFTKDDIEKRNEVITFLQDAFINEFFVPEAKNQILNFYNVRLDGYATATRNHDHSSMNLAMYLYLLDNLVYIAETNELDLSPHLYLSKGLVESSLEPVKKGVALAIFNDTITTQVKSIKPSMDALIDEL